MSKFQACSCSCSYVNNSFQNVQNFDTNVSALSNLYILWYWRKTIKIYYQTFKEINCKLRLLLASDRFKQSCIVFSNVFSLKLCFSVKCLWNFTFFKINRLFTGIEWIREKIDWNIRWRQWKSEDVWRW